MSLTLDKPETSAPGQTRLRIIDSDIHPSLDSPTALYPWLSKQWQEHHTQYGNRPHGVYAGRGTYPRFTPNTARRDAWPPSGKPPGSDLAFMQKQHLDLYDIEVGVLEPLVEANAPRNLEFAAATTHAANEWQIETFTSKEKRLRASILIPGENPEAAVAEIELRATDPHFAQIQLGSRSMEPIGRKRYWPIFAAAQAANLPIGFHIGGPSANAPSPSGWPSFYAEDHHVLLHSMQTQISSMILEGVFEHFPNLRVVMIEGGFGWAPNLAWRLDAHWAKMRSETPYVKDEAVRVYAPQRLVLDPADGGTGEARGSAQDLRVDRLGQAAVCVRLPALGLRRPVARLPNEDVGEGEADGPAR